MPRKQIVVSDEVPKFAVCMVCSDGTVGWLIGGGERGTDVKTYSTLGEAQKAAAKMTKDPHYSWSIPLEAREFRGFERERKE